MNVRFYVDSTTDAPHIHNHEIDEDEVIDVLTNPGRIARVGTVHVWSLAKLKQGAIFESFTFPTLSQTAYL
jgi:hypothetical protein